MIAQNTQIPIDDKMIEKPIEGRAKYLIEAYWKCICGHSELKDAAVNKCNCGRWMEQQPFIRLMI